MNKRVLVVDDDENLRLQVKTLLKPYSFDVSLAETPKEAVNFLEQHPHTEIVLLDIDLGQGASGIELLDIIKNRFKYVQVIMLTVYQSANAGVECMKKGAADYMTKPFHEEVFLAKARNAFIKREYEILNDGFMNVVLEGLKKSVNDISEAAKQNTQNTHSTLPSVIKHTSIQLENLIILNRYENNNLLSYYSKNTFNLKQFIEDELALIMAGPAASYKKINFACDFEEDMLVSADKNMIAQIIWNILIYALRSMNPGDMCVLNAGLAEPGGLELKATYKSARPEINIEKYLTDKYLSVFLEANGLDHSLVLGLLSAKYIAETMKGYFSVQLKSQNECAISCCIKFDRQ